VSPLTTRPADPVRLSAAGGQRFARHVATAFERARRSGRPVLASVAEALPGSDLDPLAVITTSRRDGEPWWSFEQPDRDRLAFAALGCARALDVAAADNAGRFVAASAAWHAALEDAAADPPDGPPGAGLGAVGGFAFAGDGGSSPAWDGFGPGSLQVPECALVRHRDAVWLTVNADVAPDDTGDEVIARVERRLAALRTAPLPLMDPDPVSGVNVHSVMPPSHYEAAVARAVERIRAGELAKIVLAREVEVRAPAGLDPAAVLSVLREGFPACFTFAVGRGDAVFLAASPELLVRRQGARASTVALAGSIRRSADPAVDDHLGEQLLRSDKDRAENEIVARRIERALAPHAVWVAAAPEPGLVKVANIQHLGRPIRAQLARPLDALRLAAILHPTPAVGGEPWPVAEPLLPALEGFDRGWYAGPVGWIDSAGDGEFCVALRCALLRGTSARLFAGAGIVADSDSAAELAETEVKLGALLPILAA
jgi:isochorismate synthase